MCFHIRNILSYPCIRQGTIEEKATIHLNAGQSVDVLVLYTNTPPPDGEDENGEGRLSQPALMRGVVSDNPKLGAYLILIEKKNSAWEDVKRLTRTKLSKKQSRLPSRSTLWS